MLKWLSELDLRRASGRLLFLLFLLLSLWRGSVILGHSADESYGEIFHPGAVVEVVGQMGLIGATLIGLYIGMKKKGTPLTGSFKRGLGLDDPKK